jgi:hypothetical protein
VLSPIQFVDQNLEIPGEQLLPEGRIAPRAGQIIVRHGSEAGHGISLAEWRVRVIVHGLRQVTVGTAAASP